MAASFLEWASSGLWATVAAVLSWRESRSVPWLWLLMPVVAALATLVNPYGIDLWRFLLETVRPGRDIVEWQPLWTKVPQLWLPLAGTVSAMLVWRLWPSWPATAVILMLWYAGTTVARIAYLAVPVTLLLIAPVSRRPLASTHVGVASALTCRRRRRIGSSPCDCVTGRTGGARDVFLRTNRRSGPGRSRAVACDPWHWTPRGVVRLGPVCDLASFAAIESLVGWSQGDCLLGSRPGDPEGSCSGPGPGRRVAGCRTTRLRLAPG